MHQGFFARLHYEDLRSPVEQAANQPDGAGRAWVPGLSIGIGKEYTLYKKIKGYALAQYNLLHEKGRTPYLQPLQAKVGFYLSGKNLQKNKQ